MLLLQAFEDKKLPLTIMRPSHSYGEGGGIIRSVGPGDTFVDRLRKQKPVIVQGDGNSLWAACHVDDVARGFIGTMGNPRCLGEAYNITGDDMVYLEHLPRAGRRSRGRHVYPGAYPDRHAARRAAPGLSGSTYDILSWPSIFDNSKLKHDTGYSGQTISFREGTRRTLKWLEENQKLKDSDGDTYEDALIAAWQAKTAELPKQQQRQ